MEDKILHLIKLFLLSFLILCSCSTTNKPTIEQFVNNPASMTKALKSLDNDLTVKILKTGVQQLNYVRIIALKLSGTPVIVAISQTNLKNKTFKNIIANADVTPIGTKLFAPNSLIKRKAGMEINQTSIASIKNSTIQNYILGLGYTKDDNIIMRTSQFYYQKEDLDLVEYILPSINNFLK